jgi:hypothetical protein
LACWYIMNKYYRIRTTVLAKRSDPAELAASSEATKRVIERPGVRMGDWLRLPPPTSADPRDVEDGRPGTKFLTSNSQPGRRRGGKSAAAARETRQVGRGSSARLSWHYERPLGAASSTVWTRCVGLKSRSLLVFPSNPYVSEGVAIDDGAAIFREMKSR